MCRDPGRQAWLPVPYRSRQETRPLLRFGYRASQIRHRKRPLRRPHGRRSTIRPESVQQYSHGYVSLSLRSGVVFSSAHGASLEVIWYKEPEQMCDLDMKRIPYTLRWSTALGIFAGRHALPSMYSFHTLARNEPFWSLLGHTGGHKSGLLLVCLT